jgi:hypothetical protein
MMMIFRIDFLFWHFLSFAQKECNESVYEYFKSNIANNLIISYSKLL